MSGCVVYGEGSQLQEWPAGALRESMPLGRAWGTLTFVDKGRVRLAKELETLP